MFGVIPISHVTVRRSESTFCLDRTTLFTNMDSDPGFVTAVEEAKAGFEEGGVPIGACLVSKEGKILGRGHNLRVQKGSATLHVGLLGFEAKRDL